MNYTVGASRKKSGPPILRLAHPLAFSAFLHHVGAPADRYLRRQGLPVLCEDPDAFVPLGRAWSFFGDAAQHEDPGLGCLVSAYVGNHNLSLGLLRKLETAPTLYQALHRLVRLVISEASHLQLGIRERRDDVLFYTHYAGAREAPGHMTSQWYQLGVYLDVIRHFVGRRWVPREIGIEHSLVPTVAKEHFPGSRILTQRQVGYIAVPRSCLHEAVGRTDQDGQADDPALSKSFDYVDTLRALLKPYLSQGYPTARFAAEIMDTSVRTLERRLSAYGLTYGALIDEVRFELAKGLLQEPGALLSEVSQSVGFDDQSNFTRMFRRIGGLTPGQMRRAAENGV